MANCFFSSIKTKVFPVGVMFMVLAIGIALAGSASLSWAADPLSPRDTSFSITHSGRRVGHSKQAGANYILDYWARKKPQ